MLDLIKMTPNPERARNILKQIELRLEDANAKDPIRFSTLIIEAYYEIIKELLTALLAVDGYKVLSHTSLIEYLRENYAKIFMGHEIQAIDELRKVRHRISYEGLIIGQDYYLRKRQTAKDIINKIRNVVKENIKKREPSK